MCSFILLISSTAISAEALSEANRWIRSRGPDQTHLQQWQEGPLHIAAVHNLLDISGSAVQQPVHRQPGRVLLFNGEIYSPSDGHTPDTEVLYEQLLNGSLEPFLQAAHGEYAIASLDLSQQRLQLFTDLIGTKPLAYGWTPGQLAIASYPAALNSLGLREVHDVAPNSRVDLQLDNLLTLQLHEQRLHQLDLRQDATSLQAWNEAFLQSVAERAGHFNSQVFVPLSAGYDSGAICCALNQLGVPYVTATVGDSENLQIIRQRVAINRRASCTNHHWLPAVSDDTAAQLSIWLQQQLGTVRYSHLDGTRTEPIALHEDAGAVGLAVLCKAMRELGFNTLLSGSGADEIVSDYGHGGRKLFEHSEFGGQFPEQLEGFFPWRKFYGDSQRSYLRKDEMVAGLFGIEGRYPFLDRQLIQAFLRLSPALKNARYKHCIASFLEAHNYPYEAGVKTGFYAVQTHFNLLQRLKRKAKNWLKRAQPS
jgi:asparagine synthetase B (glutamine-hydrolysing)